MSKKLTDAEFARRRALMMALVAAKNEEEAIVAFHNLGADIGDDCTEKDTCTVCTRTRTAPAEEVVVPKIPPVADLYSFVCRLADGDFYLELRQTHPVWDEVAVESEAYMAAVAAAKKLLR